MKAKRIKIISGGQTGADRAALDAAYSMNAKTGGFCPKGFRTEAGNDKELKKFGLKETVSRDYSVRTRKNILISDGVVLFCALGKKGEVIGKGTKLTLSLAKKYGKPYIINPGANGLIKWGGLHKIRVLNVAGSRESQSAGIYRKVRRVMRGVLKFI